MQLTVSYGEDKIKIEIPYEFTQLNPNKVIINDNKKIIKKALDQNTNSISFNDFISNSDRLLVILFQNVKMLHF